MNDKRSHGYEDWNVCLGLRWSTEVMRHRVSVKPWNKINQSLGSKLKSFPLLGNIKQITHRKKKFFFVKWLLVCWKLTEKPWSHVTKYCDFYVDSMHSLQTLTVVEISSVILHDASVVRCWYRSLFLFLFLLSFLCSFCSGSRSASMKTFY